MTTSNITSPPPRNTSPAPRKWFVPRLSAGWVWLGALLLLGGVAWATQDRWLPAARERLAKQIGGGHGSQAESGHAEEHGGHSHDHSGHDEASSLELSPQARRNIGLKVAEVKLQPYDRAISIPSMVVERPGQTEVKVAAPITGIVTAVYPVSGEAVESGKLLFKLKLTHEDLVQAQTDFLRTLGQLDVEKREIARLEKIGSGAVAGKVVLERQYARDKLEADLTAQRESLLLHGLSDEQLAHIERERRLLRELDVYVPRVHPDASLHDQVEHPSEERPQFTPAAASNPPSPAGDSHPTQTQRFLVTLLAAKRGDLVQAGDPLCVLADYSELYIQGRAFEQDAEELSRAAQTAQRVSAVVNNGNSRGDLLGNLEIVYVANQVEAESRALYFYVRLPNTGHCDAAGEDGRCFLRWRFRPGQRMQVRVPVERWENVIVLPVDAVAQDGPDYFVFVENGDHFDRRPVHIAYRDQLNVVIANDGSLFPGETAATNGASQLQMALKNKAGGGVDPHAGHNH